MKFSIYCVPCIINIGKVLGLFVLIIVRSVRSENGLGWLPDAFGEFGVLDKLLKVGN